MKGLVKGQASHGSATVSFGSHKYECANLMERGVVVRTRLLIGVGDRWNIVDVTKYGIPDSNLEAFRSHVEASGMRLTDFGIDNAEKEYPDHNLHHADFLALQEQFPPFTYLEIARYDTYMKKLHGKPMVMYFLRRDLKAMQESGRTINEEISHIEAQKNEIINNQKPKFLTMAEIPTVQEEQRRKMLTDRGFEYNEGDQSYTLNLGPAASFTVSLRSIVDDTVEDFQAYLDNVDASLDWNEGPADAETEMPAQETAAAAPATEAPQTAATTLPATPAQPADAAKPKPPVSIEIFGTMKADRISELVGLEEKQRSVVAANPFVKIADAATLKQAKAAKAALLKASTDTEKIETNASKYLNAFKDMIKKVVLPAAKITRDAHQKQAEEITRYEKAEEIRLAEEQRAKLAKINERSTRLFAVPFAFDGQIYSIGSVYITPSQIETLPDADFDALVAQGVSAKADADAAAEREAQAKQATENALRTAAETLRGLGQHEAADKILADAGLLPITAADPQEPVPATPAAQTVATPAAQPTQTQTASPAATPAPKPGIFVPEKVFEPAKPGDYILQAFDDAHGAETHQKPGYIQVRAYMKEGRRLYAAEIAKIFASDSQKKASEIKALNDIMLNA